MHNFFKKTRVREKEGEQFVLARDFCLESCSFNFGKDSIALHYDEQRCRKEIRPQNKLT